MHVEIQTCVHTCQHIHVLGMHVCILTCSTYIDACVSIGMFMCSYVYTHTHKHILSCSVS